MFDYYMENEREIQQFVKNNIVCNISFIVEEIAKCENSEFYEDALDLMFNTILGENDDPETEEEREVFEHWIVTDRLGRDLLEKGETVCFDFLGHVVWARTTTGQEIALDGVICEIHRELNQ